MTLTLSAEHVAGILFFCSVVGVIAQRLGFVTLTPKRKAGPKLDEKHNCAENCPDHKEMENSIKVLFDKLDSVDKKLNGVSEDLQYLCGRFDGGVKRAAGGR
jgi:hypothetical protein